MSRIINTIILIYRWAILAIAFWNIIIASTMDKECEKITYYIKGVFWVLWSIAITI